MTPSHNNIRIGTRASQLALWQANYVAEQLLGLHPDLQVDLIKITTTGDKTLNQPLRNLGGKALFLKEIEEALLVKKIDLAVHSMKDVPANMPAGLTIGAVLPRENPSDALILKTGKKLQKNALVATGSLRRRTQLAKWRPDLRFLDIRGNIDTRLTKLSEEQFDALVLATAGLNRLGWHNRITQIFEPALIIPAPGQGAIGVEIRSDNTRMQNLIAPLNDDKSACCVMAERAFSRAIGGDCSIPVAAWGRLQGKQLKLTACVAASLDDGRVLKTELQGHAGDFDALGKNAADEIAAQGGAEIIQSWQEGMQT